MSSILSRDCFHSVLVCVMVCQMEYFRSIEGKIFGGQTLSFSKYGKKLISCDIGGIVIYHIPDVA